MRRTREFYDEGERRERAEQALRQSQKMEAVGQLTGGVAHDFNNLLTIIIGNIGIAKRGVVEARAERALDNALVGAERAAQLTQRLLAFSRLQPLNPRAVDANRLILGMSDLLNRSLGEAHRIGDDQRRRALEGRGRRAPSWKRRMLNLALNARDAMPDGGKLTIETSNAYLDDEYCRQHSGVEPGQYVLIAVTDNGVGMTADTARSRVRAVLHHQGSRQGHRARPEPGLRLHEAIRRPREDLQRARRRHDREALSAALRRRGDDAPARRRRRRRAAAAARRS